ncbi:threonine aldolase family protein [Sphingosinicella rhizophila]|uniref:GntG family PLP-dependent aldolase n=1 Tax=Sphingosinicella rhizophila TaxID=3050082 RepID=A0ABU3Q8N5_9SPHN|nr:GntG family PLP-dependent aldolase [Sphingosinicella sp. GR2756]MDT9599767.1 GntG family PLP-dependent aldolase [Sphingosinicella sp. GR2756]
MQRPRERTIDLTSDTVTRPSPGMYEAMVTAELGDEQKGTDPTVNALCDRVAELLGKEAAVFLPSGVMCNTIAILVQCRPGEEVLTSSCAHLLTMECAAPSAIAGVTVRGIEASGGIFSADDILRTIPWTRKRNVPNPTLISIENTCNRGGGSVWPMGHIWEIRQIAVDRGIAMHMDGARLLNASVASGVLPSEYSAPFDTVWIDLSKGLGCPVGAVLAGSSALIENAWVWKHRLGGAMRQAGVLAAAGLYALVHNIERLEEDHKNARKLAAGLGRLNGVRSKWGEPETNIVFLDVSGTAIPAAAIGERLLASGIHIGVESEFELRAITHLDVSEADIDTAVLGFEEVLKR